MDSTSEIRHLFPNNRNFAPKLTTNMRTACLVSGGVDSAVAVHLLKEAGMSPDLFYIKIGSGDEGEWACSEEEDWEMATAVARHYGCPIELVDLQRAYWERVIGYVVDRLQRGLTPNTDVMCNRYIKFGCFEERIGKDYDQVATGHYARTEVDTDGYAWLCTSPDAVKDQTDFLAQLDQLAIRKALFPVGALPKEEVRSLALREHLAPARRRDSQGICFLGSLPFSHIAAKYLGEKQGVVVEQETGNVIGTHRGYWFYTIGQRKGLGFAGGPWFVVRKNVSRNIVYVSHTPPVCNPEEGFPIAPPHWITLNPFANDGRYPLRFKVRHTPEFTQGWLQVSNGTYRLYASSTVTGIAPGQFAVLYDEDCHRCYGSAEIM